MGFVVLTLVWLTFSVESHNEISWAMPALLNAEQSEAASKGLNFYVIYCLLRKVAGMTRDKLDELSHGKCISVPSNHDFGSDPHEYLSVPPGGCRGNR